MVQPARSMPVRDWHSPWVPAGGAEGLSSSVDARQDRQDVASDHGPIGSAERRSGVGSVLQAPNTALGSLSSSRICCRSSSSAID